MGGTAVATRRWINALLAACLTVAGLGAVTMPAQAADDVTLVKKAPASVLLGDDIPYELTATNPSSTPQYNIGFSDVLPAGFEYKAGSVSPDIGKPTITTRGDGRKVLVWKNVADLQPAADFQITFKAQRSVTTDSLSPSDTNDATVATQSDPRYIPSFNPDGTPKAGTFTSQASATATSARAPFEVDKSQPNPESELLRGVHDQRTVYTLKVSNNKVVPTNNVVVSDYLPAGLEFLGCGDVDNSAPGYEEYPGSGPLGVPAMNPSDCLTPDSVDTVVNPGTVPGIGALPSGTYTRVTWTLGNLAASQVREIKYVAAIPLKQNTDSWAGTRPSAVSGHQGSNLDNNNGASTRELSSEASLTNHVVGVGDFQGSPHESAAVADSETVTIEDLRLLKSVSPETFAPGGIATFTLRTDASEYMNASDVVVTDTLPDGFCPLGSANHDPGNAADCAPTGDQPSVPYTSVTANPDGTYTIVFPAFSVAANASNTITFPARMRDVYRQTGDKTVAGDSFKNTAALTGTTNAITPVSTIEPGEQSVGDASSASLTTNQPQIDKQMKPRLTPMKCALTDPGAYGEPENFTDAEKTFRLGDTICFKLRVNFPNISTKNPVVTDFVPVGTEFIEGSATTTANSTAPVADSTLLKTEPLSWTLGGPSAPRFVNKDAVFEVVFAVKVLAPSTAPTPDLTGNLMKLRTENTEGKGYSFRDQVDFQIAPPPNLSITKGVIKTTAPADTFDPPSDHKPVQQGSTATFQIDIKNTTRNGHPGSDYAARGIQSWDVLPAGITCAAISNHRYIKPGTNTVAALTNHVTCQNPPVNGQNTLSYIKWSFPTPDTANDFSVATGQTLSVLYDMALPTEISVSTQFNNTAYVRSFEALTNNEGDETASFYPENNIDQTVTSTNAPEMKDPSDVYVPNVSVSKSAQTSVDETNNNAASQATIGESITYTYRARIPAGSTVFNATLSDVLPAGISLVSVDGWGLTTLGNHPAGFSIDAAGKLTFPATYSNTTASTQEFLVQVTAKVTQSAVTCADDPCVVPPAPTTNVAKTNTARFVSKATLNGTDLPARTATATVNIVQPNPAITKSANPTKLADSDEVVTYTVTISNPANRPPLHEPQVIDCLPAPMVLDQIVSTTAGTAVAATVPGQCANAGVSWTLPTLAPGATQELKYKAHLVGNVPADQTYTNTATLTGTSMPGTVEGERTYKSTATADITTPALDDSKETDRETATIGEQFTSTITVNLPKQVDFYSLGVVDTLPTGVDPASVTLVGITCKNADDTACAPPLTGTALTPFGQKIGWSFGDVTGAAQKRTVAITYHATVADIPGNTAGKQLTNSARPYWSDSPLTQPPTTIGGFEELPKKGPEVTDTVKVLEPSVSIVKKVDGQDAISATPGQTFLYTIKVSNAAGDNVSTAYDIAISDLVPSGVEVVQESGSPSDGGTVSGATVTWPTFSLAPGADKTLSFKARLKPPATTVTQTNTATVNEYCSLDDAANTERRCYDPASDSANVTPVLPDLTIQKSDSGPLAYIDEPYTWTVTVTNNSGATAYGVDIIDTLPPNWVYVADSSTATPPGTPAPGNPAIAGQTLTWTDWLDLDSGESATLTYQAEPTSAVVNNPGVGLAIPHENEAYTSWTLGPPADGWGTDQADEVKAVTHIASADLALLKTHVTDYPQAWNVAAGEVVPGTEFNWVLKATNLGEDPSMGPFTVVDTLPAGVTYKGYNSGSGWSCTAVAQVVTCTIPGPVGGLAKGQSLSDLVVTVEADAGATGELKNTATVTGHTYDPNPGNNKAEDPVTARPLADVAIVKTRTQPYVVGDQVTYTLTVTNLGPSVSVAPIKVVDQLPTGLSIASVDAGPWDCQPTGGPATELTCTLDEDLAPSEQAPLIHVTVDVLESPGTTAVNTAEVIPTTEDPNEDNNTSVVEDPVVSEVKLDISKKTTGANPVTAGKSTQFTVTVKNLGPAKAKNVKVVDTLEAGLKATSATGAGWTCDIGSGTVVTCTRADFPVSASPSDIVIEADVDKSVPGGTTLKNTATVTTTSPQPGGDPDPATSTVDVVAKSDLGITKTHDGGPWTVGKTGTWRLEVTNHGPSDNPGPITVIDQLPVGTEFVSATGDRWTCTAAERTLTCVHTGGLAVGTRTGLAIRVNVVSGAHPRVLNTADVFSPVEDTDPANNRATDEVPVERAKQTADKLPPTPSVLPARRTEQGQKIRTKVRCRTLQSSAAGEASYCKVRRSKNGTIRVKVVGSRPVRVIVTQFAKGTKDYEPFLRVRKYIVRP